MQESSGRQDSTSRGNRPSEHGAGIAVASDGDDLSVHDVNMLGERNDAEDGVDVHERDAMLAINNEPDASRLFMIRAKSSSPFRNEAAPRYVFVGNSHTASG